MKTHIIQLEEYDDIISTRDKMGWARGERILLIWPERRAVLERRLDLVLLQRRSAALGAQLGLVARSREVRYQALRLGIPVFKSLRQAQNDNWRLPRPFRKASAWPASAWPAVQTPLIPPTRASAPPDPLAAPAAEAVDNQPEGEHTGEDHRDETVLEPASRRPARPEIEPIRVLTQTQRLAVFAMGVLAVLAIAAMLLPQAQITYVPQTRVQAVIIDVQAGPAIHTTRLTGQVPARWKTITVEGRDMQPSSGSLRLPDQTASGQIVFTNLSDQTVNIPTGTVVRTLGDRPVRFAVTRSGTLPAGPGEQLSLPGLALAPGVDGNLPANSLVALEGLLGTQVKANNPQPTRGGSDRHEPAPTAADRRRLTENLRQALEQTAREELFNNTPGNDLLIPSSLVLVETLQEEYLPADEQMPADQLHLHLRLEFQALVVASADLRRLSENVFDANLPGGFLPVANSLRWESLQAPRLAEDKTYRWQVHANRHIIAQASLPDALRVTLGATPARASRQLQETLHLEEPPQIYLRPAWWPVLPILPFRITLTNQAGQVTGAAPPAAQVEARQP